MADVKGLLADPTFNGLDEPTQRQVLGRIDPAFTNLDADGYRTFRQRIGIGGGSGTPTFRRPVENMSPAPPTDEGFWSTLWHDATNIGPRMLEAGQHPLEAIKSGLESATAARRSLGPKAEEEFAHGSPVSGAAYWLAAKLPFIGPAAAGVGEEIGGGQTGQGLAHATELLAPFGMKAASELPPLQSPVFIRGEAPAGFKLAAPFQKKKFRWRLRGPEAASRMRVRSPFQYQPPPTADWLVEGRNALRESTPTIPPPPDFTPIPGARLPRPKPNGGEQLALPNPPAWSDITPTAPSPGPFEPVPQLLPSGRVPGNVAPPVGKPSAPNVTRNQPVWKSFDQPRLPDMPPIQPIAGKLPSGKSVGGLFKTAEGDTPAIAPATPTE